MNYFISPGSSPRRIRQNNVVAALQCLYAYGCMSRADLARKLGLNRSSSGQIVTQLTESGLVREVEDPALRREEQVKAGRPGIMLELVPEAAFFVGVEIGVEHITVVQIDLCAQVRSRRTSPFDAPSTTVEEAIRLALRLAFEGLEVEMLRRCKGVGLSAPAHIASNGFVSLAPLIGWRNIDLAQLARNELPVAVPIIVENDANALAIGDGYKRERSGVTLFLNMETGVGAGILIDRKLFRGGHGLAGEIGHMLVPGSGKQELEQLVGRERLVLQYRQATERSDVDFSALLSDVRDRVPAAVSIADDWARNLGYALVQACRLIDPDRIVFGGSVASLYPMVAARVAAHMAEGQTIAFPAPEIVVDEDAELGSAFGAACLLHQRFMSLENEDFTGEDGLPAGPIARDELSAETDESERR
jgi:predicted NBD/HSP70 family sugar kinase